VQPGPTSLLSVDPATNEVVAAVEAGIPLLSFPALTAGNGVVWLADQVGHTVSRFDAITARLTRTVAVPGSPRDIAVGAGAVWVIGTDQGEGTLIKINPATGAIQGTFDLPYSDPVAVTVSRSSVWIAANDLDGNAVIRVDASEPAQVAATFAFNQGILDIAGGDAAVWATAGGSSGGTVEATVTVTRIDAGEDRAAATIDLGSGGGTGRGSLALVGEEGWVIAGEGVVRFDTKTDTVTTVIAFTGNDLYAIAADAAGVWVGAGDQPGRLLRIDPVGNTFTAQIDRLNKATVLAVAIGASGVWAY
jgi:hypothetical protein